MTNVEALLVGALNTVASFQSLKAEPLARIEAFMDVPAARPVRFVTVERTGGGETNLVDQPMLAVQFWAESRYEASEGARKLALILEELPVIVGALGKCRVESVYNWPDDAQPRYQLTVSAATVRG